MESEFIVYLILATVFIGLLGASVFVWINMKDRSNDEKMYANRTDPKSLVSKNKHVGVTEEDTINPMESLKKYAVGGKKTSPTTELSQQEQKQEQAQNHQKQTSTKDDSRFAPPEHKSKKLD